MTLPVGRGETMCEGVEAGQHVVQFYEHDEDLTSAVSDFLGAGLVAGESVLVVATPDHRQAFEAALAAAGLDVFGLRATGHYRSRDADELVASLLVEGEPDAERFSASVGRLVADLRADGASVRIYGEMVALLWERGAVGAAMAIEELWNELGSRQPLSLFCAYPAQSVAATPQGREAISREHVAVVTHIREQSPRHPDEVVRFLQPTPFAAQVARRFVRDALRGWQLAGLADNAELVVSELVSNAIRHGGQRFRLTVSRSADGVRLAVTDPSPALPTPRTDDLDGSINGRGMHLIEAVSCAWGTTVHPDGKTVWADIAESVPRR
jgi:MEDS: MEthanogen/methylotroph, DcmR Sensory domain/Histidine kinase-like ATPase domain